MKAKIFIFLSISIFLFSCQKNISKITIPQKCVTDSARTVNLEKNFRLGKIHANELNIKLEPEGDYEELKTKIKKDRENLLNLYNNSTDKQAVIDSVENYLFQTLMNKVIPFWYGTPWSLSGYSDIPNEGFVGCSYFVSNTLKHLGFNINRFKVGQAASWHIAKTFQLSSDVIELRNYEHKYEIVKYVKNNLKEGFYIVGLDCHVGYILYYKDEVFFVHSSYIYPGTVVIEYAEYAWAFSSGLYIIGEITTNDDLIVKWLNNEFLPVIE